MCPVSAHGVQGVDASTMLHLGDEACAGVTLHTQHANNAAKIARTEHRKGASVKKSMRAAQMSNSQQHPNLQPGMICRPTAPEIHRAFGQNSGPQERLNLLHILTHQEDSQPEM